MFDIAWSELFVIMVVALVVVGPKDLPKLMRSAGQWAGRARAMADQFRRSFDDMARQAELDELRNEVNKLKNTPMTDLDYESFGITDIPAAPTSSTWPLKSKRSARRRRNWTNPMRRRCRRPLHLRRWCRKRLSWKRLPSGTRDDFPF